MNTLFGYSIYTEKAATAILNQEFFYHHSSNPNKNRRILSDFANSRLLHRFEKLPIKNFFSVDQFHLFILDNEKRYTLPNYSPTHILLRNDPKINLDRLL